jgi:hypothetical protein
VRVAFIEDSALTGDPVTVIQDAGGCSDPRAIYDGDGDLYVVADCGPLGGLDIAWATNASGDWASDVLPGQDGHEDYGVEVALDDGAVAAVWTAGLPCDEGTCNNLQVAWADGDGFAAPVSASQAGTPGDSSPTMAVGSDGRVLIAFHRDNAAASPTSSSPAPTTARPSPRPATSRAPTPTTSGCRGRSSCIPTPGCLT